MRTSYDVFMECGGKSVGKLQPREQVAEIDRRMEMLMEWAEHENCVISTADIDLVLCAGDDLWKNWLNGVNTDGKEYKGHTEEEKHHIDERRLCVKKWVSAVKAWDHMWTRDNGKNPLGLFTLKSSWRFSEYEKEGANVVISLDDLVQAVAKKG